MTGYNPISLQGFYESHRFRGELHQKILACLSINPMSREALQNATGMEGNTLRPRVVELLRAGYIEPIGEAVIRGCRVEILGLREHDQPI